MQPSNITTAEKIALTLTIFFMPLIVIILTLAGTWFEPLLNTYSAIALSALFFLWHRLMSRDIDPRLVLKIPIAYLHVIGTGLLSGLAWSGHMLTGKLSLIGLATVFYIGCYFATSRYVKLMLRGLLQGPVVNPLWWKCFLPERMRR